MFFKFIAKLVCGAKKPQYYPTTYHTDGIPVAEVLEGLPAEYNFIGNPPSNFAGNPPSRSN